MKYMQHIIRGILTIGLIYGAYKETGVWTALNFLGLWISVEVHLAIFRIRNHSYKGDVKMPIWWKFLWKA